MGKQLPWIVRHLIVSSTEAAPKEPWAFSCWWLWIQVLTQAVRDADNNINSNEMRLQKDIARNWLCSQSADFSFVCDQCGFDPRWAAKTFVRYFEGSVAND